MRQIARKIPCFHGANTVKYGKNTLFLERGHGEFTPNGAWLVTPRPATLACLEEVFRVLADPLRKSPARRVVQSGWQTPAPLEAQRAAANAQKNHPARRPALGRLASVFLRFC